MNSKLLILSMVISLGLASCGKKTETVYVEVEKKTTNSVQAPNEEQKKEPQGQVVKPADSTGGTGTVVETEANITFEMVRAVSLELDRNDEITNLDEYVSNLNRRKIIATNTGRALDRGVVKCVDVTNPVKEINLPEVGFKNYGTKAEVEILLQEANTTASEYVCNVFESGAILKKSTAKAKFYADKLIATATKYNDLGIATGISKRFGAIVFLETGALISDGKDLDIQADEIVIRPGGKIQTFLEKDRIAANYTDGANGGNINIKTDYVTGKLKVSMAGQIGGAIPETDRPAQKTNIPEHYRPGILDGIAEEWDFRNECHWERYKDDEREVCVQVQVVTRSATSGRDAYNGDRGNPGRQGTKGGNTGIFSLVTDRSELTFNLEVELIKGKGGAGQLGGLGGPPSPAGQISCQLQCAGIKAGAPGNQGLEGASGEQGLSGIVSGVSTFTNITDRKQNRIFN